jgi:hypothetical protein
MKLALLTGVIEKGSEDDNSFSKNFSEIWKLIGPPLISLVPILIRLAFARIGAQTGGSRRAKYKSGSAKPDESPANVAPDTRKDRDDEEILIA